MIDKSYYEEYAKLAVINGVNVQKGQLLVLSAPVEAYDLIRQCVKVAYEAGASKVIVNYDDDQISRMHYEYMPLEELCDVPDWQVSRQQYFIDKGACFLHIVGEDPDLLNGIDQNRIKEASLARMKKMKQFQYYTMNNVGQWSIIAYPNLAWA